MSLRKTRRIDEQANDVCIAFKGGVKTSDLLSFAVDESMVQKNIDYKLVWSKK